MATEEHRDKVRGQVRMLWKWTAAVFVGIALVMLVLWLTGVASVGFAIGIWLGMLLIWVIGYGYGMWAVRRL